MGCISVIPKADVAYTVASPSLGLATIYLTQQPRISKEIVLHIYPFWLG